MPNQIFVGDVGTQILVDTGEALAGATKTELHIKKPSGLLLTKTATISGTTSLLYTTVAGDLDEAGEYVVQAYVELAGWKGHGAESRFAVYPVTA